MGTKRASPIERWMRYIFPVVSGCWLWTGQTRRDGYGYFTINSKLRRSAHSFSYRWFVGEVPAALQLDHLCHNRRCVNPDHLEAVTASVNALRGYKSGRLRGGPRKGHKQSDVYCPVGHPYNGDNLVFAPKGYRICRMCRRRWGKEYRGAA